MPIGFLLEVAQKWASIFESRKHVNCWARESSGFGGSYPVLTILSNTSNTLYKTKKKRKIHGKKYTWLTYLACTSVCYLGFLEKLLYPLFKYFSSLPDCFFFRRVTNAFEQTFTKSVKPFQPTFLKRPDYTRNKRVSWQSNLSPYGLKKTHRFWKNLNRVVVNRKKKFWIKKKSSLSNRTKDNLERSFNTNL